jgi:hypothetical protein
VTPELAFSGEDVQGRITKDAIILEQKLANSLKNKDPSLTTVKAAGQTLMEIVKRDKNFGKLLMKIK